MREQNNDTVVSLTQSQIAKMIADAVAKVTVKQTVTNPMQVMAMPTGKMTALCIKYTEYFPVYRLINPANPKQGFITQVGGQYAGRPKAFGFKKQNRKEIILTWANGAEVRFMKTSDSPKVHDSRTPTMAYGEGHVLGELKRVLGDDNKAIKGAKWLMDVITYDKVTKDPKTLYGKLKVDGVVSYRKVYGEKKAGVRQTVANVPASVPLSADENEAAATDSIPF